MRVEIALIASIVCFCCWCAYILIKMSYSATSGPSPVSQSSSTSVASSPANSQQHLGYYAASSSIPQIAAANHLQLMRISPASALTFPHQLIPAATDRQLMAYNGKQQQQQQQQPGHFYAAHPPYSLATPTPTWTSQQSAQNASGGSPIYLASPIRATWPIPHTELLGEQPAASELEQDAPEAPDSSELTDTADPSPLSDNEAVVPDAGEEEEQPEEDEQQPAGEEAGESSDESAPELEERAARRSFTEDQTESTERDRAGRPIFTRRRHLVNGKPVRQQKTQKNGRDFDSVAREIDALEAADRREKRRSKKEGSKRRPKPARGSVGELGLSRTQTDEGATRTERKLNKGKGRRKKKERRNESKVNPRESHQHRLSESLSAQQWDDDSGNAKRAAAESASMADEPSEQDASKEPKEPELKAEDAGEEDENHLLDEELDMFAGSDEFPFVETPQVTQTQSQSRQRRSLNYSHDTLKDLDQSGNFAIEVLGEQQQAPPPSLVTVNFVPQSDQPASIPWSPENATNQASNSQPSIVSNGHSGGPFEYGQVPMSNQYQPVMMWSPNSIFTLKNPATGASKATKRYSKKKKKKENRKFKKSAMADSKYKAAKAHQMRKVSKFKKAGSKKKKKSAKKKLSKKSKEFKASTKGSKGSKGLGQQGAKKGALYINDKGYKKKGFKKAYKKLEVGDHKTYFDEFRDRDHNKRWKNYKDKHHYSQRKNWAGKDAKKFKNFKSKESKYRKSNSSGGKNKVGGKYRKDFRYNKGSEFEKKKKKKKSNEEEETFF